MLIEDAVTTDAQPLAAVFSEGATASSDYFLFPYLERLGYRAVLVDSRTEPPDRFPVEGCGLVVIARYVSTRWLSILAQLRQDGVRLAYFMDDDLFDLHALSGLPWGLRWKIFNRAYLHRRRLLAICDEFWVSTAYLADKYASAHPMLLSPIPTPATMATHEAVVVCYHGTPNHRPEIEWLVPVIQAVQACTGNVHFELFGAPAVNGVLKRLPRVSVLQPMTWPNYLSFTACQRRDLGLAPLLSTLFNEARGATKFFDYARMGAVGLYSDRPPFRGFIEHGVDGLLIPNDPARWAEVIIDLAGNVTKRKQMAAAAQERLKRAL